MPAAVLTMPPSPVLRDLHLVLFMTEGMSLRAWEEVGMFDRETAIYRRLRPLLRALTIISYGDRRDLDYRSRLQGIRIICNRGLPADRYRNWLATQLPRLWRGPVLVKTNQTAGTDLARQVAERAGAWFLARCGYWLSDFMRSEHGPDAPATSAALALEARTYPAADHCVVTTSAMADRLALLGVPADRADILPNYVDTELFAPTPEVTPGSRLVFVGRLAPQKNPHLLVEAARVTGLPLDIVGGGHLLTQIRRLAEGLPVTFHGNQPHTRLPDLIRGALCFLFPSNYEGHPKALLEAMACGLPVVAADRPGIREMIRHGETGLLVEPETASIAAAIRRLQSDSDLCRRLGAQARAFIEAHFSLEGILEAETALYRKLLGRPARLSAKGEG